MIYFDISEEISLIVNQFYNMKEKIHSKDLRKGQV